MKYDIIFIIKAHDCKNVGTTCERNFIHIADDFVTLQSASFSYIPRETPILQAYQNAYALFCKLSLMCR